MGALKSSVKSLGHPVWGAELAVHWFRIGVDIGIVILCVLGFQRNISQGLYSALTQLRDKVNLGIQLRGLGLTKCRTGLVSG